MKIGNKMSEYKEASCFTYEVKMIIQVMAEDEIKASESLDKNGGYVTKREVKLLDTVALHNG